MSLNEKWINTIFSVATGSALRRKLMTPVGFILFLTFMSALFLLSFLLDSVFKFPVYITRPLNLIIGLPLIVIGFALVITCVIFFLKSKGTPVPLNPPKKIITGGPYAFSRNPMMTGIFFLLFGFGVFLGSVSLTFIVNPLFILFNYFELKKIEEPELVKRFGQEYIDYRDKIPMFFPRFFK